MEGRISRVGNVGFLGWKRGGQADASAGTHIYQRARTGVYIYIYINETESGGKMGVSVASCVRELSS